MERTQLPIDKGWAWVITLASCGIFGFITGSQKSRGIILVELQEKLPEASVTSLLWVLNVNFISDRLLGPLNGMILARTSNRTMSLMGSCIMTASLVAFAHSPRIEYMFVAYALYGWGTGMNSISCMTAYQPYFDKMKALSLGITGSGSGVGTLVLSALLRVLFDNFSFTGALLLNAGVCMQTFILASLLRPFSFYDRHIKLHDNLTTEESTELILEKQTSLISQEELRMRSMSVGERRKDSKTVNKPATEFLSIPSDLNTISVNRNHQYQKKLTNAQIFAMSAQDISSSAVILDNTPEPPASKKNTRPTFNFRLAYNPRCILLGIATLLHVSAMMGVYPCIPPLGVQTGVSKKLVSILLASAGGLEIPMRIAGGWLADTKLMTAYTQLTVYMFLTGITALLCAAISGTAGIVLVLIGLSSTGTSVFTLLPVVCGELFGSENVRSGMSIIFVYQGLAIIVASFSTGGIYERRHRWEDAIYYLGASMIAGGAVMLSTAAAAYCIKKRQTTASTSTNCDE